MSAFRKSYLAALAQFNLTHMRYMLLATGGWLCQRGEMPNQTRLSTAAGLDRMMVAKVLRLRLLEDNDLIKPTIHPADSRAYHVQLSPAGRL